MQRDVGRAEDRPHHIAVAARAGRWPCLLADPVTSRPRVTVPHRRDRRHQPQRAGHRNSIKIGAHVMTLQILDGVDRHILGAVQVAL